MKRYADLNGNSAVAAYELGEDSIKLRFNDGRVYLYDADSSGAEHVTAMRRLAEAGRGLATYLNKYVRDNYARKIR